MKKLKKLLAGLLGAAMVLTSFGTPAWADSTNPAKTSATIDTSLKGSITIHKYEYNGNAAGTGTGETTDQVPSDAKELAGAGFTIYKVADVNDLKDYYSANPSELPAIGTYVTDGKINSQYENNKVGEEKKTDAKGEAVFSDLELGFYVVIETTTPDKVTTPVSPFIVSIPMTTSDGDNWLYDVHVYPKNATTYGNVKLKKTGNDTESLAGVKFVLQKEENGSWTTITQSEQDNAEFDLTTKSDGTITVSGLSQGTYRFIETDRGDNDGYIMDGASVYKFVIGEDGKTYKEDGTTLLTDAQITVNNEKPDMTKEVQNRENVWGQDADYNVGDLIPYKITIDVPSNITSLKEFNLTDTPTNLEDITDGMTLRYKTSDELTDVASGAYTITKDDTTKGFKIEFTPASMGDYAGKQIVITYNAKLLDTAVTTTVGNPNTAKLEYSNSILPGQDDTDNPNKPDNPDETPKKDVIEDNAIVYTFAINIHKEDNKGTALKDVEFDLYKETTEDDAHGVSLDGLSGKYVKINTASLKTGEDGNISQGGLANGTYYLVETKTNEGYNLLKSPVKVELSIQYTTTTKTETEWTWVDDDTTGGKKLVKNTITSTTFTEGDDNTTSTGIHTETIINRKGFELPKTGDIGTALFLIIGIGGMLMAVYIMLKGRKRA